MCEKNITPIDKAIHAAGGQSELAKLLGIKPQNISIIKKRGGEIPTRKISADEWSAKTGLSKSELFPSYYN